MISVVLVGRDPHHYEDTTVAYPGAAGTNRTKAEQISTESYDSIGISSYKASKEKTGKSFGGDLSAEKVTEVS